MRERLAWTKVAGGSWYTPNNGALRKRMQRKKRKLERVRYWQGQMLRSGDFRNIEGVEEQRRWWHNRALHTAHGVAEGFDCELVPQTSPPAVRVGPGIAYDAFGRELILEKPQTVRLPLNVAQEHAAALRLLIRYRQYCGGLPPDQVSEICWTQTGGLRPGTVEFSWKSATDVKPTDGVSICGVLYSGKASAIRVDLNFAAFPAQPVARPLLPSGTTIPGNTPWQPWMFAPFTLGVQTWIDTSAAGFTRVPCYFAWLQGPLWNPQTQQLVPAILPSITDESTTGFTFRLWLEFVGPTYQLEDFVSPHRTAAPIA